jgi:hypothetical protein
MSTYRSQGVQPVTEVFLKVIVVGSATPGDGESVYMSGKHVCAVANGVVVNVFRTDIGNNVG